MFGFLKSCQQKTEFPPPPPALDVAMFVIRFIVAFGSMFASDRILKRVLVIYILTKLVFFTVITEITRNWVFLKDDNKKKVVRDTLFAHVLVTPPYRIRNMLI
jgi:hypothetical protein